VYGEKPTQHPSYRTPPPPPGTGTGTGTGTGAECKMHDLSLARIVSSCEGLRILSSLQELVSLYLGSQPRCARTAFVCISSGQRCRPRIDRQYSQYSRRSPVLQSSQSQAGATEEGLYATPANTAGLERRSGVRVSETHSMRACCCRTLFPGLHYTSTVASHRSAPALPLSAKPASPSLHGLLTCCCWKGGGGRPGEEGMPTPATATASAHCFGLMMSESGEHGI
jgi:hypothetical protein